MSQIKSGTTAVVGVGIVCLAVVASSPTGLAQNAPAKPVPAPVTATRTARPATPAAGAVTGQTTAPAARPAARGPAPVASESHNAVIKQVLRHLS